MSSSNCCFLTCIQVSQEAGQVVWYSRLLQNFPQFIVIHTVEGFGIVNKAEIYVFQELSCFFDDPADVGDLVSGSPAFSKTSLNIWKFSVHILLKPGLENFEHYFTNVWDECNCAVVWAFFGIAFLRDWMKTDLFQSCGHCWVFQICQHIECSTFTASSFRVWNSSTVIPSHPLASGGNREEEKGSSCSPPGSSVHIISQARILEWVAISFSRELSNPGINPALLHWQADFIFF